MLEQLRWKKYPVLNDGYICLVDVMGDDSAIVQAARVSYGKDENPNHTKNRSLIRRLIMDSHTSPFEMVEFKFKVRVPMDCWRQWIRHRTASVNEYSTRYSEAIDSQQTTLPGEWRLQAKDNKQGSSGFLEEWPKGWFCKLDLNGDLFLHTPDNVETIFDDHTFNQNPTPGEFISWLENKTLIQTDYQYRIRIDLGVAREQARKDLPLSTYTEAYWKCDLHNIFNFLRLRLDSHAQLEIRLYAQAMYEIVKQICPIACEAFEDYVLNAKRFSAMEMAIIKDHIPYPKAIAKQHNMTDNEWKSFLGKIC